VSSSDSLVRTPKYATAKETVTVIQGFPTLGLCHAADRRTRERIRIRWPVAISRREEYPRIHGITENLSSSGLYCISPEPLRPSEDVSCRIAVPDLLHHHPGTKLVLVCRAHTVRVDETAVGFGIGLEISDYVLVERPDLPAGD
jgi:hypothetical protein